MWRLATYAFSYSHAHTHSHIISKFCVSLSLSLSCLYQPDPFRIAIPKEPFSRFLVCCFPRVTNKFFKGLGKTLTAGAVPRLWSDLTCLDVAACADASRYAGPGARRMFHLSIFSASLFLWLVLSRSFPFSIFPREGTEGRFFRQIDTNSRVARITSHSRLSSSSAAPRGWDRAPHNCHATQSTLYLLKYSIYSVSKNSLSAYLNCVNPAPSRSPQLKLDVALDISIRVPKTP